MANNDLNAKSQLLAEQATKYLKKPTKTKRKSSHRYTVTVSDEEYQEIEKTVKQYFNGKSCNYFRYLLATQQDLINVQSIYQAILDINQNITSIKEDISNTKAYCVELNKKINTK